MSSVDVDNAIHRERQRVREFILASYKQVVCKSPRTCNYCSKGLNQDCPNTKEQRGHNDALRSVLGVLK